MLQFPGDRRGTHRVSTWWIFIQWMNNESCSSINCRESMYEDILYLYLFTANIFVRFSFRHSTLCLSWNIEKHFVLFQLVFNLYTRGTVVFPLGILNLTSSNHISLWSSPPFQLLKIKALGPIFIFPFSQAYKKSISKFSQPNLQNLCRIWLLIRCEKIVKLSCLL